jgi:hypothetical protein
MSDLRISLARLAVRRAADRLTEDAGALTAASAEAREVGLTVRIAELRRAVIAARRAGVSCHDLAHDARVAVDVIESWGRPDDMHPDP